MVVVAHPDDELLGLGGTIHRLVNEFEATVRLIILGEGITSRAKERHREKWEEELKTHKENISEAVDYVGYQTYKAYDFADNRFDTVPLIDLIKVIEEEAQGYNPSIVFTHHGGDLNVDHQQVFKAVMTAFRPIESQQVKTILTFETPSSTEWVASNNPLPFRPNVYIALRKENLKAKIDGMQSYTFEKRDFPHPRSPKALKIKAQSNGCKIGVMYAEAFELIRSVSNN